MGKRRKRVPAEPVEAVIESLTRDGRGVAHLDGKAVLIRIKGNPKIVADRL